MPRERYSSIRHHHHNQHRKNNSKHKSPGVSKRRRNSSTESSDSDLNANKIKQRRLEKLQLWKQRQEERKKYQEPTVPAANRKPSIVRRSKENCLLDKINKASPNNEADNQTVNKENEDNFPEKNQNEEEIDPLDAFMYNEVIPEVIEREKEEIAKYHEEKLDRIKKHSEGKSAKIPKILQDSDSDENADLEINIPTNKVKLLVGPSGMKIQEIQKKSKCRIQIKKDESEMNRAFGSGPKLPKANLLNGKDSITTILVFGDKKGLECAKKLVEDAIENKEQRQKQREKEYEKKKEAKRRDRQIYHLRHSRDYEILGLPLGASKPDIKAAYRKLVLLWHPDKQADKTDEEKMRVAKETFSEIQRAYQSLMLTDEDDIIKQIGH